MTSGAVDASCDAFRGCGLWEEGEYCTAEGESNHWIQAVRWGGFQLRFWIVRNVSIRSSRFRMEISGCRFSLSGMAIRNGGIWGHFSENAALSSFTGLSLPFILSQTPFRYRPACTSFGLCPPCVHFFWFVPSFPSVKTVSGRLMPAARRNKPDGSLSLRALSARLRTMRTPGNEMTRQVLQQ